MLQYVRAHHAIRLPVVVGQQLVATLRYLKTLGLRRLYSRCVQLYALRLPTQLGCKPELIAIAAPHIYQQPLGPLRPLPQAKGFCYPGLQPEGRPGRPNGNPQARGNGCL